MVAVVVGLELVWIIRLLFLVSLLLLLLLLLSMFEHLVVVVLLDILDRLLAYSVEYKLGDWIRKPLLFSFWDVKHEDEDDVDEETDEGEEMVDEEVEFGDWFWVEVEPIGINANTWLPLLILLLLMLFIGKIRLFVWSDVNDWVVDVDVDPPLVVL